MRDQFAPGGGIGNKSADFGVFQDQFSILGFIAMIFWIFGLEFAFVQELEQAFFLDFVQAAVKPFDHSEEGRLGGVGDKGEDGMLKIVVDGFQNRLDQLLAQLFPLEVDIQVVAPGKVDSFERAGRPDAGFDERQFLYGAIFLMIRAWPGDSSLTC